jgi:hypothetical protein
MKDRGAVLIAAWVLLIVWFCAIEFARSVRVHDAPRIVRR